MGIATLFTGIGRKFLVGIDPKALWLGARTKPAILVGGALALTLFSGAGAQAQCTPVGLNTTPLGPVVTQAAGMAVANVSASVGALVSSINSADTVLLTQSSAFIGSPANPQPDQQGGGVWARGVGGHLTYGTTASAGNISFGGPVSGNITCNTRTIEDFAGVQPGTDIARLNVNGWNLHGGLTVRLFGIEHARCHSRTRRAEQQSRRTEPRARVTPFPSPRFLLLAKRDSSRKAIPKLRRGGRSAWVPSLG